MSNKKPVIKRTKPGEEFLSDDDMALQEYYESHWVVTKNGGEPTKLVTKRPSPPDPTPDKEDN